MKRCNSYDSSWRARSRGPSNFKIAALLLLAGSVVPARAHAQTVTPGAEPQTSTAPDSTGYQGSFGAQNPYGDLNCADPMYSSLPICGQRAGSRTAGNSPLYVDSAGLPIRVPVNSTEPNLPPQEPTDFQRLVRLSTGQLLPIFGSNLFRSTQLAYGQQDRAQANGDYVIGPGDQILLRLSGPQSLNSQLTVDRSGQIFVPQVGSISVAGLRYDQLEEHVRKDLGHFYRNFELTVNLGQLRSSQVYVVGEVRQPGTYSVGPFSSILTALAAAGGPGDQGSLRRVQLLRTGQRPTTFDLYGFLLQGDKAQDSRLEPGDVIVVPPAGPQVALAGSVRHPAIFELAGRTTVADVLRFDGGLLAVASDTPITLERLGADKLRRTLSVPATAAGQALELQDGDLLIVPHITTAFTQTVAIRGNVAQAGQFAYFPGMRLSDIIPDRLSLLTNDYWNRRNELGAPAPLFQPLPTPPFATTGAGVFDPRVRSATASGSLPPQAREFPEDNPSASQAQVPPVDASRSDPSQRDYGNSSAQALALQTLRLPTSGVSSETQATSPQDPNAPLGKNVHRIAIPAPEIDWSYAVIERLNHETLKSELLPFNLGRLVLDHDPSQNLVLQPGDVVTILSQADIPASVEEQTKFVRLEGELVSAGVYSTHPGETLRDLVIRAGGLTPQAYLYGSSFFRESARLRQQQNLDEYIASYSLDLTRSAAQRAASSLSSSQDTSTLQQHSIVDQLRSLRSTGRVLLEFKPTNATVENIPAIPLENGDVFRIPPRPNTVNVIGAVYGQSIVLYDAKRRLGDYVNLAGRPNRVADPMHAFVIRADGSIFSRELAKRPFSNNFDSITISPGDAIVIPEKLIKPSALRNVLDYSQLLSSFGISAAAINGLR